MSLRRKALAGTFWTTVSAATRALIQILRLSILTRYLEKSDFGLVAIVVLVLGFTHIFTDLGVSVSLYSAKNVTRKEYSSLYWVSLGLGIFLYGLLLLSTPLVAAFYSLPELNQLIPLMGLDLIFVTVGRQFRVFREKELRFRSLAFIDISCLLLSLVVAVWLAMEGAGVYSLIISALSASFFSSLLLLITGHKSHPLLFYINIREGKPFYRVGFYQTGSQILDYISSQLDILLIGKLMSTSDLGVYNLVKQLVSKIFILIGPVITQVSVPLLAAIQYNADQVKENYLRMLEIIAFVNCGLYGLMALLSPQLLSIIYGPSYVSAYQVLQILCIWGVLAAIGNAVSTVVLFKGRTDTGFKRTLLRIIVNPIFIVIGSHYGLMGIAIGQACYAVTFFVMNWRLLIYSVLGNISFKEYTENTLPCLFVAIAIFFILDLASSKLQFFSRWESFFLWGIAFGLFYMIVNRKRIVMLFRFFVRK